MYCLYAIFMWRTGHLLVLYGVTKTWLRFSLPGRNLVTFRKQWRDVILFTSEIMTVHCGRQVMIIRRSFRLRNKVMVDMNSTNMAFGISHLSTLGCLLFATFTLIMTSHIRYTFICVTSHAQQAPSLENSLCWTTVARFTHTHPITHLLRGRGFY